MESFFFNITDKSYKVQHFEGYKKVDISNGIIFFDVHTNATLTMKNLDRMLLFVVCKNGTLAMGDKKLTSNNSTIFASSRQDFTLKAEGEVFILFVADFFLKRYLSGIENEPIDFLYQKMQGEVACELVDTTFVDALSLYIIKKIVKESHCLKSIRCEHYVLEFMIHRLSLLDIIDKHISKEDIFLAKKAKAHLLQTFAHPPTISELAHLCATNESKLKTLFKDVYQTTIYATIQKLRLKEANLLLKDGDMSIGDVAKEVGYKHQGHFSKLFFEHYGVYPKDLKH